MRSFAVPALLLPLVTLACADHAPLESVLLITVDTLRPDYMSMNGYPQPTTPFLDELLGEGTYFDRAVTPIPRTTQALASLLTGAYPHTTGVRTLTGTLQPSVRTLAEVLESQGYQTRAVVTNHILDPRRGLFRGFQHFRFLPSEKSASPVTEVALAELEKVDPEQPLFLWVHYLDPHIPYAPPKRLAEQFDPGYEGPYQRAFALRSRTLPESERGKRIHRGSFPERVNEHVRSLYAATYRSFDDGLAPLVERARELFGDELLIVFTADHGESLGEHDFYWDHGDYVYNATTRVPLAFVFPPAHPLHGGRRLADHSSLVDVAPTIFELVDLPVPAEVAKQIEGRSLVSAIRGEPLAERAVFAERGHCYYPALVERRIQNDVAGRFRAVFLGDWKLIWTPFQTPDREWELYDVVNDPHETKNLYDPDRPEIQQLRAQLQAWLQDSFQDETPILEGPDLEALKALGYIR